MIFVTLGTQKFAFKRILELLVNLKKQGLLDDEIIAQVGFTDYDTPEINQKKFFTEAKMKDIIKRANLVITHGGTGSIITALELEKKVLAVPRLKVYSEHVDDHQLDIVSEFHKNGYIECYLGNNQYEFLNKIKITLDTNFKEYKKDNKKVLEDLLNYIIKEKLN
ncbi:PssE/Cps14G family polysaccharide biosynthesis glycosyltransferase [Rossellomorea vietnamensis]|uniref:PssE/Cps14G family polysaccharide biosynthesis glycosyltransferase n=1 Tax=Rossellomorea vietnamensis TaxID=218284 RepID=UPI003CEC0084